MNTLIRCCGVALMLSAVAIFANPAKATHLGFQHSNNCVKENVLLPFNAADIGTIVDLVYEQCGNTATTTLFNGPYRRISNWPNPSPIFPGLPSEGDARRDMVVYDSDFKSSNPCKVNGPVTNIVVSNDCIAAQIGVTFVPAITLRAVRNDSDTSAIAITDTTGSGAFPEGQLVDAGPGLGGFDCAVLVKNGSPKTADVICDTDMWYEDAGTVKYGFRGYDFGQPINRLILMWLMGPNPTGSMAVTDAFCNAANANGRLPARNFADDSLELLDDPSDYGLNPPPLREEWSAAASTDYIRVFGENVTAFNALSCLGTVTYCDLNELPPDPDRFPPRLSGNSCTEAPGAAAPSAFRSTTTVPQNPSLLTQGGTLGTASSSLSCPYGSPPC